MAPIRIAIVGLGKIARDQHLPAIGADDRFALAATVSPGDDGLAGVPHFGSLDALLGHGPPVDAVALCTPPQVRFALAGLALRKGIHVLLEKPPAATLSEVAALVELAEEARVTLFAAWHSRFAAGVAPARAWLAPRRIDRVEIIWREDVRVWHPGQDWIWQPGGLGVFDPGINALSIATEILPHPLSLRAATLSFPANRAAPIAAELDLCDSCGAPVRVDLDFRQTGPQSWDIAVDTDEGRLVLSQGGAVLTLPSGAVREADREYPALYGRFAALIRDGAREVDVAPFCLVADAFLRGATRTVEPFED